MLRLSFLFYFKCTPAHEANAQNKNAEKGTLLGSRKVDRQPSMPFLFQLSKLSA